MTDDLVHYKTVADKLDLEHQICQIHVRRWVGRTLKELRQTVPQEWLWGYGFGRLPWLSEFPLIGSVPGGECQPLAVTFDASEPPAGMTYNGRLQVANNDPNEAWINVPVHLTVDYCVYSPLVMRQGPP